MPGLILSDEREGRARVPVYFEDDFATKADLVAFKSLPNPAIEGGVISFPDPIAEVDAGKIDVAFPEAQHRLAVVSIKVINTPTFFFLIGPAGIKDDAIARFGRTLELEGDAIAADLGDASQVDAAFGAEASVGKLLILHAAKPTGVEAARKPHF